MGAIYFKYKFFEFEEPAEDLPIARIQVNAPGLADGRRQPVRNVDLQQRLEVAPARHDVKRVLVCGHAENECAAELARRRIAGQ